MGECIEGCLEQLCFVHLGFNEADIFKSSSILIYLHKAQSICTQSKCHDAMIIKKVQIQMGLKLINSYSKYSCNLHL